MESDAWLGGRDGTGDLEGGEDGRGSGQDGESVRRGPEVGVEESCEEWEDLRPQA